MQSWNHPLGLVRLFVSCVQRLRGGRTSCVSENYSSNNSAIPFQIILHQVVPTLTQDSHLSTFLTVGGIESIPKIIYSSRTHSQLSQAINELKNTIYRLPRFCFGLCLPLTIIFFLFKAGCFNPWFSRTDVY